MTRLELRSVSAALSGKRVLERVSFRIAAGELVGLVGPNGAGKTTALRVAAGLLPPESGEVLLDDLPIKRLKPVALARRRAVVPQFPTLPSFYSVREVVTLGRTPHIPFFGRESAADREVVERVMAEVDIGRFAARSVDELSGGERQRVAIARALAQEPALLILDEPTASLDLLHQRTTLAILERRTAGAGLACVVALHDLSLAAQFCDRVILLAEGRVVADGAPGEVLRADLLASVYGTSLRVVAHPDTGSPVVVHAGGDR